MLAGKTRAVETLLTADADVNALASDARTPLFIAADTGNLEAMKLLLNAKAKLDLSNRKGNEWIKF